MSNDRASFEDWVNGVTRPVIGVLLGLALGAIIKIVAEDGLMMGLVAAAIACLIWFGMMAWRKLEDRFGNFLFGGAGVRPARKRRAKPGQSPIARLGRYGLPVGIVLGSLVELVMPQSVLGMVV